MEKPLISVIVPIYNVENYLRQCIESLINQEYNNIEIILVNDGSKDRSLEICKEYMEKDNRIIVIDKRNEGLLRARMSGIEMARGEYISFLDGDDFLRFDYYQKAYEIVEEYSPDIIAMGITMLSEGEMIKIGSDKLKTGYYDRMRLENEVFPIMMCNKITRYNAVRAGIVLKITKKRIIENIMEQIDPQIDVAEDASITYPCIYMAKSLYFNEEYNGYIYRIINNSMSHSYRENWYDNVIRFENWMKSFFSSVDNGAIAEQIVNEVDRLFIRGILEETSLGQIRKKDLSLIYKKYDIRHFISLKKLIQYGYSVPKIVRLEFLRWNIYHFLVYAYSFLQCFSKNESRREIYGSKKG